MFLSSELSIGRGQFIGDWRRPSHSTLVRSVPWSWKTLTLRPTRYLPRVLPVLTSYYITMCIVKKRRNNIDAYPTSLCDHGLLGLRGYNVRKSNIRMNTCIHILGQGLRFRVPPWYDVRVFSAGGTSSSPKSFTFRQIKRPDKTRNGSSVLVIHRYQRKALPGTRYV